MKLIDSHCHLDFEPLPKDLEDILRRAREAGVIKMINIGTTLERSRKSVDLAEEIPNVWASVGIHPQEALELTDINDAIATLGELAKSKRVVAIGEIGLDYNESRGSLSPDQKKDQQKLFLAQLKLAVRLGLPVIIHVRDAWDDFFSIIRNSKLVNRNSSEAPGVIHCFTGDAKMAKRLTEMGFLLGFTGFVTFDQKKFDHIRKAVQITPLENILVETDAPFLAPDPYRGRTNEPSYVVEVAKKVSELKRVSQREVAKITTQNAEKLFNI